MLWLNPVALFALAAIAAPILIHILVQRRAERFPFPTLRFLQPTRLAAIRRHLLEDWRLLAVRAALLAAAAAALAGPLLVTAVATAGVGSPGGPGRRRRRGRRGPGRRARPGRVSGGPAATHVQGDVACRRHPARGALARHGAAGAARDRDRVAVGDRIDHRRRHRGGPRRHRHPLRADRHAASDTDRSSRPPDRQRRCSRARGDADRRADVIARGAGCRAGRTGQSRSTSSPAEQPAIDAAVERRADASACGPRRPIAARTWCSCKWRRT